MMGLVLLSGIGMEKASQLFFFKDNSPANLLYLLSVERLHLGMSSKISITPQLPMGSSLTSLN